MKTYRTAIIGCGRRAYGHANAYQLISNAKLVACSNKSDLSRRRKFANTYNTASYSSAKRMIEEEKPDLVHLVTMPDQSLNLLRMVSELGVPACLVEKPIAYGVRDWQQLCELEAKSTTKFGVSKQFRWHPRLLECRKVLQSGQLGRLKWLNISARMNLSAQGTHMTDWAMFLNNDSPVSQVFGNVGGVKPMDSSYSSPAYGIAEIVFANGIRGFWHSGTSAPMVIKDPTIYKHTHIMAYAELGQVSFEEFGRWLIQSPLESRGGQISDGDRNSYNDIAQAGLIKAMLDWIENDQQPVATNLKLALHQWNTILGLYTSAILRKPVEIPFNPSNDLIVRLRSALGQLPLE